MNKRYGQGWVMEKFTDLDELIPRIKRAKQEQKPVSLAYFVWCHSHGHDEHMTIIRSLSPLFLSSRLLSLITYQGNVVELWERLVQEAEKGDMLVDLGSDQTSLHNPFNGGYYPVQLTFAEAKTMMFTDPGKFKCVITDGEGDVMWWMLIVVSWF